MINWFKFYILSQLFIVLVILHLMENTLPIELKLHNLVIGCFKFNTFKPVTYIFQILNLMGNILFLKTVYII